jgi:hypothetical protein
MSSIFNWFFSISSTKKESDESSNSNYVNDTISSNLMNYNLCETHTQNTNELDILKPQILSFNDKNEINDEPLNNDLVESDINLGSNDSDAESSVETYTFEPLVPKLLDFSYKISSNSNQEEDEESDNFNEMDINQENNSVTETLDYPNEENLNNEQNIILREIKISELLETKQRTENRQFDENSAISFNKININQKLSELVQIIIPIEDSNYSNIAVNESHEIQDENCDMTEDPISDNQYSEKYKKLMDENSHLNSQILKLNEEMNLKISDCNFLKIELNDVKNLLEEEKISNNELTTQKFDLYGKCIDLDNKITELNKINNELNQKINNIENNHLDVIELNNLLNENNCLKLQIKEANNNTSAEKNASKEVITNINSKLVASEEAYSKLKRTSDEQIESLKNEIFNLEEQNKILFEKESNKTMCNQDLIQRTNKLENDFKIKSEKQAKIQRTEFNDFSSMSQYEQRSIINSEFPSSSQNVETKPKTKRAYNKSKTKLNSTQIIQNESKSNNSISLSQYDQSNFKSDLDSSISSQKNEFCLKPKKAVKKDLNNKSVNESIITSPTTSISNKVNCSKLTLVKLEKLPEKVIPSSQNKRKIDEDVVYIDLTSDTDELPDLKVCNYLSNSL